MLRQLLTILALFSGLATAAEPAHATRIASAVTSAAMTEQGQASTAIRASGVMDSNAAKGENPRETFCANPIFTVYVPTIMLRIDRSHE